MSDYAITVVLLFAATVAQTALSVVALRTWWRPVCPAWRLPAFWLALGGSAALLALHALRQLRLAMATGLYDLPQGILMSAVSFGLLFAIWRLKAVLAGKRPPP